MHACMSTPDDTFFMRQTPSPLEARGLTNGGSPCNYGKQPTNQPKYYQTLRLTRPSGTRTHTQTNGDLPVRGGREAYSPSTLMPRISESETTINALGLQGTAEGRTDRPDMMGGRKIRVKASCNGVQYSSVLMILGL